MELALISRDCPGKFRIASSVLSRLAERASRSRPPQCRAVWWCNERYHPFRVTLWATRLPDRLSQETPGAPGGWEWPVNYVQKRGASAIGLTGTLSWTGLTPPDPECGWTTGETAIASCCARAAEYRASDGRHKVEFIVIGADSALGGTIARLVARQARYMVLSGKNERVLTRLAGHILSETGLSARVSVASGSNATVGLACRQPTGRDGSRTIRSVPGTGFLSLLAGAFPSPDDTVPAVGVPKGVLFDEYTGLPVTRLSPGAAEAVLLLMAGENRRPFFRKGGSVEGADRLMILAARYGFTMGDTWVGFHDLPNLDNVAYPEYN